MAPHSKNQRQQLGQKLEGLDNFASGDLKVLREQRLRERKKQNNKKQAWLQKGHGIYSELDDEKKFFEMSKKSPNFVCHFYRDNHERCKIVDMHLKVLAVKHVEARFCKVNAEKTPFLNKRLRINVMPTIVLVKDSKTKDFIIGFKDLGNRDDFATNFLEWRIAQSEVIEYKGDLTQPPNMKRNRSQKTKGGGGYDSDDSD